MELASALGTSFAADDLAELSGYGPGDLAAAIDELLNAGLVVDDPPWLRFRHELLREALATRLAPGVNTAAESLLSRRADGSDVSLVQSDGDRFGWASLTPAERRIARLVAEGLTNREIAARLSLSPHTIDYHLKHVFSKLGCARASSWPGSCSRENRRRRRSCNHECLMSRAFAGRCVRSARL